MTLLQNKEEQLNSILKEMKRVAIAYSGGVDSAYLLFFAKDVLGDAVLAVTADSDIHPSDELKEAIELAQRLGVKHHVIHSTEMEEELFLVNPPDRCYHCKRKIFSGLIDFARSKGFDVVIDGSNMDDTGDYRPGRKALKELGIRSPLQEAGLTKADIRVLSEKHNLPTWNKPALACLASRIPYGTRITTDALKRVEKSEKYLRELGFIQLRVRDYGTMARLEFLPEDIPRLLDVETRLNIVKVLRSFGYQYVSLDLEGYRTGSLNEALKNG